MRIERKLGMEILMCTETESRDLVDKVEWIMRLGWENVSSCGRLSLISIKTFLINCNYPRVHEDKIHLGEGENDL